MSKEKYMGKKYWAPGRLRKKVHKVDQIISAEKYQKICFAK